MEGRNPQIRLSGGFRLFVFLNEARGQCSPSTEQRPYVRQLTLAGCKSDFLFSSSFSLNNFEISIIMLVYD